MKYFLATISCITMLNVATLANDNKSIKNYSNVNFEEETDIKKSNIEEIWDKLDKKQKDEIYKLEQEIIDKKIEIIQKYKEFGMITEESSKIFEQKLNTKKESKKKRIPMLKFIK